MLEYQIFLDYWPMILLGFWLTLKIVLCAIALGIPLGLLESFPFADTLSCIPSSTPGGILIETVSSELSINIDSFPYWGFGLFSSCYLNKVELKGSLISRAKLIFDIVATLGRNPWEPKFSFFWEKVTKNSTGKHRDEWLKLLTFAKRGMEEEIEEINSRYQIVEKNAKKAKLFPPGWNKDHSETNLKEVRKHIEIARQALHDQNAVGLKRALDRAEAKLIEADPLVGLQNEELLQNQNLDTLEIDNIPFIDLVNDEEE